MSVGERFRQFRRSIDKTQNDFAGRYNLSRTSISLIENNINNPSFKMLCNIAHDYDLNIHWLITGEGQMFGHSPQNLKVPTEQASKDKNHDKADMQNEIKELQKEIVKLQSELIACQSKIVELLQQK